MAQPRTWQGMWAKYAQRLEDETGDDVATWNARVAAEAPDDEAGVRAYLDERGVTGYPQALLVMERFGWPDFLTASEAELVDGQYADREHLRPILDAVLEAAHERHPDLEVVARKGYVGLFTARRQFAVVKATTRSRVDLGLRLDGRDPAGRLEVARNLANETINLRVALSGADEVDDEVASLLDEAWEANV